MHMWTHLTGYYDLTFSFNIELVCLKGEIEMLFLQISAIFVICVEWHTVFALFMGFYNLTWIIVTYQAAMTCRWIWVFYGY